MKGEEVGDGRAEGLSAKGGGGQAAISLITNIDGTHVRIFEVHTLKATCRGFTVLAHPGKFLGPSVVFHPGVKSIQNPPNWTPWLSDKKASPRSYGRTRGCRVAKCTFVAHLEPPSGAS